MKRSWMGLGLLVILLVLGIMSTIWVKQTHEEMALHARSAAECALREDWDSAAEQTGQAREAWQRCWRLSATVTNHASLEQIEALFAQLEVYAAAREAAAFASGCAQLEKQLQALADAQRFHWWNLL